MVRRIAALSLLLAVALLVHAAAPPPNLPLAKWIEQLGSDDDEVRTRASDNLWKAGPRALGALKAALKHTDPDVVLRAQIIFAKVEWGIGPDTPAAVATQIERFRDNDPGHKAAAVVELTKLARPGLDAVRRLLPRATDEASRKAIQEKLKQVLRPTVRAHIVAGDLDSAELLLETVAASGDEEICLDLAVMRALRGTALAAARKLEAIAKTDRVAAIQGVYLYRAVGDLAGARRLAEWSKDKELLASILDEAEDYPALVKVDAPEFGKEAGPRAVLLHKAGDRDGAEAAFQRIDVMNAWERATVLFWTGRPKQAVELLSKSDSLKAACAMLALQGRRKEALALKAPEGKDEAQGWLLTEQAAILHALGRADEARKRTDEALVIAEKVSKTSDSLLGGVIKVGRRTERLSEVVAEVGKVLDRLKMTSPTSVFYELGKSDSTHLSLWWAFLRAQEPNAPPSVLLQRMDDWFVKNRPGEGFEATLIAALKYKPPAENQAQWPAAIARVCVLVGLPMKAEEVLRDAARGAEPAAPHQALGQFFFERKRWAEAAEAYALAQKREPVPYLPMYLRGVALVKAGKAKEGKEFIDRARLLILGDEDMRYELSEALTKLGLREEAFAEQLFLTRTALFRSVLITNVCTEIGEWFEERDRHVEAARYYRRMAANMAFRGAGFFIDDRSHLWVPAWAHQARAVGLTRVGKHDEALAEVRRVMEYLPEETEPAIELIRGYDRAGRKADAEKLFSELFAERRRSCAEEPLSADSHNRLAWLAARTGRKLDWGLRHASAATALQPRSAGVHDTLAEVRFQRGERDAALAAIRRAVELSPDQPYFAAQGKRIEKGDPKAELPPQPR